MKNYKVFAINPGSTSTKIAMFEGEKEIFSRNISHDAEKLKEFKEISDQLPYRKEMILNVLKEEGQTLEGVDAFSASELDDWITDRNNGWSVIVSIYI